MSLEEYCVSFVISWLWIYIGFLRWLICIDLFAFDNVAIEFSITQHLNLRGRSGERLRDTAKSLQIHFQ